MVKLMDIAERYELKVIEDCAQAHLATYKEKAVGTFGDVATFSFYPGKNLGAYGDAGLVLTNCGKLDKLLGMHIDHGRIDKYEHQFLAGNYRMDAIQAAILDVKLKHLKEWTIKRQEKALFYDGLLSEQGGYKVIKSTGDCVYHLYIVEVSNRDEVMETLKSKDIGCGIHYPIPLHLQPALKDFGIGYKEGDFPVTEQTCKRILSLPIFPEISKEQQEYVVAEFLKVAKR